MFNSISMQNQTLGGEENPFTIPVNVCYILKHLEDRKALSYLFIFITLDVTSFSFSNYTEELGLRLVPTYYASFLYTQFENSNDVTPM